MGSKIFDYLRSGPFDVSVGGDWQETARKRQMRVHKNGNSFFIEFEFFSDKMADISQKEARFQTIVQVSSLGIGFVNIE